jgi:hypothetical protein
MPDTVGDRLAGPERDSSRLNPTTAGAIGVLGGLLWLGALLVEYRFNLFPPGQGPAYVADQLVFGAAMLCYVIALLGLRKSGAAGPGRGARTVVAIWALGWVLVFLGLVTGLIAPDFILGEVLPAVGGLLTAVFGLVTGILVARTGVWRGWPRWIPLALYVILALFIPLFMGIEPSLFTEAGWALGYVLLGAALRTATTSGQR